MENNTTIRVAKKYEVGIKLLHTDGKRVGISTTQLRKTDTLSYMSAEQLIQLHYHLVLEKK